jgi:hypothetical protein
MLRIVWGEQIAPLARNVPGASHTPLRAAQRFPSICG